MNAPLSYKERHALQIHAKINADIEREVDPFDQDYDPTEVPAKPVDRNSETFLPARPPVVDCNVPRDEARRRLAAAKAMIKNAPPVVHDDGREQFKNITCWHNTPELYRVMVARCAGLGPDVVGKMDRDLSEREKALLRSAVRDLRDYLNSLVNL